ncbi:MAG: hypothetical protein MPN21_11925 [Thermoanaerobaculia bacterium]|nr:hypothetical protein [Thermoanaerobaculia bacterium]
MQSEQTKVAIKETIMNPNPDLYKDSPGWLFFVKASFVLSAVAMAIGIWLIPTDPWVKGYLFMGEIFLIGSTISVSKTLRDQHEHEKLVNKLRVARTEKMLSQYDDV